MSLDDDLWEHRDAPKQVTMMDVYTEVRAARAKFPANRNLTVALAEEVGELAQAQLQGDFEKAYKEAKQVAAVAIRIMEEGDASLKSLDSADRKK